MKTSNVSYNCNYKLVANRYYNPRISQFYATDPLAEKYPNFSPYTYTADNPVMLVDTDGKDWVYNKKTKKYYWDKNVKSKKDIKDRKNLEYIGLRENDISKHFNKNHNWFEKLYKSADIDYNSFTKYLSNEIIKKVNKYFENGKGFYIHTIRGLKENIDLSGGINKGRFSLSIYSNNKIIAIMEIKLRDYKIINFAIFDPSDYGEKYPYQLRLYNRIEKNTFDNPQAIMTLFFSRKADDQYYYLFSKS